MQRIGFKISLRGRLKYQRLCRARLQQVSPYWVHVVQALRAARVVLVVLAARVAPLV